ncbi:MAG: MerR family transcriptional regulator [Acidimicrobiia bacterium]|nr:MAG: MerR family transcriptional regulator [Acidimicrobiia bacterium]
MVYVAGMNTTTVGELASIAGITVRTLHHYDTIGLLTPTERRPNGYRAYTDSDIDRLQQILTYRELDLSLSTIASILDERSGSVGALEAARHRIARRIEKLHRITESLDIAIRSERNGTILTPEEKLKAFGDFDPDDYAQETSQRWGDTAEFAESMSRTTSYTSKDWQAMRAEEDEIYARFVVLMGDNVRPDSSTAAELVDAHRNHISKWFYECSPEIHAGLGSMYAADERFRSNIDKASKGLAAYMSAAIAERYTH